MEERIMDEDELRGIKKRRDGEPDDESAAGDEAEIEYEITEDAALEGADGEYDEDLVGLTPTQLKEELERREKLREEAHAEALRYRAEGEAAVQREAYDEATGCFEQSLSIEYDEEVEALYWWARTRGMTSSDVLFERETAREFAEASKPSKKLVLDAFGEELHNARAVLLEEAEPLREQVRAGQEARRAPFIANRNYYRLRFAICAVLTVLFAVGIGVSASFLLRTQSSLPTILMIVFGALTLVALCFFLYFSRKLIVASRLCRANEKLASTEEGERLEQLEDALACLDDVLGTAEEAQDEGETN